MKPGIWQKNTLQSISMDRILDFGHPYWMVTFRLSCNGLEGKVYPY
jgi:hypothetical protein